MTAPKNLTDSHHAAAALDSLLSFMPAEGPNNIAAQTVFIGAFNRTAQEYPNVCLEVLGSYEQTLLEHAQSLDRSFRSGGKSLGPRHLIIAHLGA